MVYKHQLLYVYEPIFETGGMFWPLVARRIVLALLIAQCTMMGMILLKEAYDMIYPVLLLMLLTYVYLQRLESKYQPVAEQLPFDQATSLDLDQQNFPDELAGAEEYMQPSLRAECNLQPGDDFPL